MKKFVLCISLLSAVFCTAGMAQETDILLNIAGLDPTDSDGTETYYLKNVGTGLHMSYGATWGTQCVESQAAHPVVVEDNGDGTYAIGSLGGYLASKGNAKLYMDGAKTDSQWKLKKVNGYENHNQYYLEDPDGLVLTSVGNSAGILALQHPNGKASQRWIFTNGDDMRQKMMDDLAKEDCPLDVSVAIRGGAFDYVDGWEPAANTPGILKSYLPYNQKWENFTTYTKYQPHCGIRTGNAEDYAWCGIINGSESELTVTYTFTLPKGTYHFSFEGFYKYMKVVSEQKQKNNWGTWKDDGDPTITTSDNGTMNTSVSIAGQSFTLKSYGADNSIYDNGESAAAVFRDNDTYKHRCTFYLSQTQEVSVVITKPSTTSQSESTSGGGIFSTSRTITTTSYPSQIYIDDFTLLYYGKDKLTEVDDKAVFKSYLAAYAAECRKDLNDAGKAAFDEIYSQIVLDEVGTRAEYYNALATVEEALEEGVVAHEKAEVLQDLVKGDDITGAIRNAGFENGDYKGWDVPFTSDDTGVRPNSNPTYTTSGVEETYLFNTWQLGVPITQTITGLPEGEYKLSVLVASGNEGNDATVYLMANDKKLGVNPPSGGKVFGDFSLKFSVGADGTATIGVVGGNDDDTPENPIGSFNENGHWWYKCDNFRLEYLADDHLVLEDGITEMESINEPFKKVTVKRAIKKGFWSTLVVPFDIPDPESILGDDWEVKELANSEYNAETEHIVLTFSDAEDGIKAGVPYMVRNTKMAENLPEISMENVVVNTELKNTTAGVVEFVGTYTKMDIPEGAFFISSNQFWYAKDGSNTTRAFRAYMQPTVANARAMNYRMGGTTAIDDAQLTNDNEVTVVGIYTLGGVRISEMQEGVNILQMSDGSVVKVVIK